MNRILNFLREARTELAKVEWPTLAQAIRFTLGVILVSFLVGLLIFAMDLVFSRGMRELITRTQIWKEKRVSPKAPAGSSLSPSMQIEEPEVNQ